MEETRANPWIGCQFTLFSSILISLPIFQKILTFKIYIHAQKTENPFADLCNKTEFLISPISVLQAWGHKKEINFWHENTPGWTLSNCSGFGWENYAKIICEHFLPSQNITRCKRQAKLSKMLKNGKKNCTSNFWSVSNLQKIVFYVKIMTPFKVDENNCNRLSSFRSHFRTNMKPRVYVEERNHRVWRMEAMEVVKQCEWSVFWSDIASH